MFCRIGFTSEKISSTKLPEPGANSTFSSVTENFSGAENCLWCCSFNNPYADSDPDLRVLNAVSRGLLFERIKDPADELEMTKLEYLRTLRSLKSDGLIYAGNDGKYRLAFGTSNFPNLIAHDDGI